MNDNKLVEKASTLKFEKGINNFNMSGTFSSSAYEIVPKPN